MIAITETKEVDTTVAKKNVETKNQIYTDEQISEAEKKLQVIIIKILHIK